MGFPVRFVSARSRGLPLVRGNGSACHPTDGRARRPFGIGSLQWFIDARFEEHYFTLYEAREDLHDQFRNMAILDIVANNTDRKSGHCLIDNDDRIWGIDQGLCFSAEFKLRTVIWEFGGESIAPELIAKIQRVVDRPPLDVAALLDADEIDAMIERASMLAQGGMFPIDASGQRYPGPWSKDSVEFS